MWVADWHRRCRGLVALSLMYLLPALPCAAQTYPTKAVRVIIGFAPGGPTDIIARLISPRLTAAFGQTFVVENRSGADGLIASELVARAEPDGHIICFISSAHTVNASLYKNVSFDANKDFSAITLVGEVPSILVVHPSLAVKSMREFIALAKRRSGELSFASSASITFLGTALLNKMAGIDTLRIAYKGAGPAVMALISGEAQFMITGIGLVLPHIKAGKLRPLGVSVMTRSPLLPDVPTIHESGVPGYVSSVWYAALAPTRTPRAIVDRLNSEMRKAMAEPDVKAGLVAQAIDLAPSSPDQLQDYMRSETDKWARVVLESGAKID